AASAGAADAGEARALADMLAPASIGLEAPLKLWMEPWRAERPLLVVALAQTLWDALASLAVPAARASRGPRPASVRPWWTDVLEQSAPDAAPVAWSLAEPDGAVHGIVDGDQVTEIGFSLAAPHDPDATQLRRRLDVAWSELPVRRHHVFAREATSGLPVETA